MRWLQASVRAWPRSMGEAASVELQTTMAVTTCNSKQRTAYLNHSLALCADFGASPTMPRSESDTCQDMSSCVPIWCKSSQPSQQVSQGRKAKGSAAYYASSAGHTQKTLCRQTKTQMVHSGCREPAYLLSRGLLRPQTSSSSSSLHTKNKSNVAQMTGTCFQGSPYTDIEHALDHLHGAARKSIT